MKKLIFYVVLICSVNLVKSQITNEGTPWSWEMNEVNKNKITPVVMKSFDLNKIKAEDAVNDLKGDVPYRFGYEFDVDLGLGNSGAWDKLPNGDRIWRINLLSKGARTMNFVFDLFQIPRGATIYLYNNDKTDLLGAYTNICNRPDEMLGTWLVQGENVWIEYYEPLAVKGQGKLNLGKIVHGYRSVTDAEIEQKALGSSGDCNQDVNCPIGDDFEATKDKLKRAVGFIILNGFVCTGTLINNTNNDKAPYFLTANHCESGSTSTWAFRFNWISPNPSCATTASSPDAAVNQTTSGATLLAANSESDMKLLNLDGGLDPSWDLEWAGWDRSGEAPGFVVGIHHPAGDIMKICRYDQSPTKRVVDFNGNPSTEVWNIADWDLGVTEKGSSGSALFDPNGRIIGKLSGGAAACDGVNDNGALDFYGRFDVSWDFGTTDATRLSNWLDPTNTGKTTLDMLSVEMTNGEVTPPATDEILVSFNPSIAKVNIFKTTENVIEYMIYDISGALVDTGRLLTQEGEIDMADKSSGMYFVYIKDTSNGRAFTKKVVINRRF
ncbi:T9SS type A sorting domain-containing protein [Aquimarina sp. AU474]|uniref:T9SS type A sorting domain-containing protein n=1 Tax=Aquimarina sp. AU474 TaxID=2108529 RepID=UPI000D686D32|nr:T9SS type A sorting domain-containing protein [Aquimarina sp. AU474]